MPFVAFDLEIATEIPEGVKDWREARPLRVSCAATLTSDGERKLWTGGFLRDGHYSEFMRPVQIGDLIQYLLCCRRLGYDVVTWNGLGFDFAVLADEAFFPQRQLQCRELALGHVDMAFQMLCEKGFMCGLEAAAVGMDVPGKMEEVGGAKAPAMWKGSRDDQDLVLRYVAQDVQATAAVYEAVLRRQVLMWLTKAGRVSSFRPQVKGGRLLTAQEALELPLPDTSWLKDPWPRSKFAGWALQGDGPQPSEEAPGENDPEGRRKIRRACKLGFLAGTGLQFPTPRPVSDLLDDLVDSMGAIDKLCEAVGGLLYACRIMRHFIMLQLPEGADIPCEVLFAGIAIERAEQLSGIVDRLFDAPEDFVDFPVQEVPDAVDGDLASGL